MSYPPARALRRGIFCPVCVAKGGKWEKKAEREEDGTRRGGATINVGQTKPALNCEGGFRELTFIAIVCELTVNSVVPDMDNMGELAARSLFCSVHPLLSLFLLRFPFFLSLLTKTNDGREELIMSRYFT